jgi:hypothetical protein
MKFSFYVALTLAALSALCLARSDRKSDRWSVREQETIQNTLTLSSEPMRLVVDNVNGYVHATGTNGSEVRVTAHKVIRAETDSDLQEAKNEVKLQVTGKPGTVSIYYDAPWRCNNGEGDGCHGDHRRFYEVVYDIDVEVPRRARTVISTINDGDIRVAGIDGAFDVHNVNGAISMTGVSGSGDARTVNGPVNVHFAKNPAGPGSFKTINGGAPHARNRHSYRMLLQRHAPELLAGQVSPRKLRVLSSSRSPQTQDVDPILRPRSVEQRRRRRKLEQRPDTLAPPDFRGGELEPGKSPEESSPAVVNPELSKGEGRG